MKKNNWNTGSKIPEYKYARQSSSTDEENLLRNLNPIQQTKTYVQSLSNTTSSDLSQCESSTNLERMYVKLSNLKFISNTHFDNDDEIHNETDMHNDSERNFKIEHDKLKLAMVEGQYKHQVEINKIKLEQENIKLQILKYRLKTEEEQCKNTMQNLYKI